MDFRVALSGDARSGSLGSRAARSGIWVGGGFIAQRALQLVSNLMLTRLLFPEAFGLMALANVFIIGLAMFSDLGIKPSIIRDPRGDEPAFLNTAWTIQVIRGFALFAIGCLLAYPISLIYDQAMLFPILATLGSTAAIMGFTSVKMSTAERDLDFRSVTFLQIAGQAISIAVMVALAYEWRSVWALAAGNVIGAIVSVSLGHAMLRGHRHQFRLEPEATSSLVHFGKWIFLSTIVTFLGGEGLRAIQGGLLTPAEFGILAIAYTIASIPIDLSTRLSAGIGLPALSEAYRKDPDTLASVLHKFRKRVLTVSLILVAAVVFTSEVVIEFLYDSRYHDAGAFVVAITLSNAVALIFSGYSSVLLAVGKSKAHLGTMAFAAITRIFGILAGFQIYGVLGMVVGVGIANLATLFVMWAIMRKLTLLDLGVDGAGLAALALSASIPIFLH